jgi:hypothetical protein
VNAIKATWTNGRIVLAEPVDWPEGSELLVEPIASDEEEIGRKEDDWKDDPESVAAWIAAVERIEPPVWGAGERDEYERYRSQRRQANIDAVRKQMEAMPDGDAP